MIANDICACFKGKKVLLLLTIESPPPLVRTAMIQIPYNIRT